MRNNAQYDIEAAESKEAKMQESKTNRLSPEDSEWAEALLESIRTQLHERAGEEPERLHLLRRRIFKKLGYDERSTPMQRRALKQRKMVEQNGTCTICGEPLPERGYYAVLDRKIAHRGYTDENVNLVHADCDYRQQEKKGYA
jgi:hypothetical protein